MLRTLKITIAVFLLGPCSLGRAASAPYDETADARADIAAALVQAGAAGVPVLVVFGANWCGDCRVLDAAMHRGAAGALIARQFRVVKVNVGRFDRNTDVALSYGVPLKKGIPAVAVLGAQGQAVYATREGELADARAMGETGIYDFFARVVSQAR